MQQTNNWEKNATIRNKAKRILINDSSKYFFPLSEQPLCFHPTIMELGEKARQYILIQSSYYFMQNILINETNVVCKISEKIIETIKQSDYVTTTTEVFASYIRKYNENVFVIGCLDGVRKN